MTERSAEDSVVPGAELLSGALGTDAADGLSLTEETPRHAPKGHRTLWASLAGVVIVGAVAVPVALHFANRAPAPLHTPNTLVGLTLDKSADAASTVDYLRSAVAAGMSLDTSAGAVYTDGAGSTAGAHSVIIVGGSTTQGTNASQVSALLGLMNDSTDGITGLADEAPGTAGGLVKCGLATDSDPSDADDTEMTICAFANKGTVGVAMFANRSVADAAGLLRQMRPNL